MSNKSVNISLKTILWILISISTIILLIILLNSIDSRKKYNQYKVLNDKILNSEYPDRFSRQIKDFSLNDTALIIAIKQNLNLLEKDFPEVNYSEIYIRGAECFYNITDYQYYKDSELIYELSFLPKKIAKYTNYLDANPIANIDSLYSLINDNSRPELMIKTGNGYLRIVNYWH